MEEETKTNQEKAQERSVALIRKLSYDEAFVEWRKLCVSPVLDQVRSVLRRPLELSEADLKAQLMYFNLVEALFFTLFEEFNQRLDEEVPEEG